MANYNTFAVVESRHGCLLSITSSARKAHRLLETGRRVEVWCDNQKTASITFKHRDKMIPFLAAEKEYIRKRQEKATAKNKNAR